MSMVKGNGKEKEKGSSPDEASGRGRGISGPEAKNHQKKVTSGELASVSVPPWWGKRTLLSRQA